MAACFKKDFGCFLATNSHYLETFSFFVGFQIVFKIRPFYTFWCEFVEFLLDSVDLEHQYRFLTISAGAARRYRLLLEKDSLESPGTESFQLGAQSDSQQVASVLEITSKLFKTGIQLLGF